jgi:CBS domain-containing protein
MSYEAVDLIIDKPEPEFLLPHDTLSDVIPKLLDHDERFLAVVQDSVKKKPVGLLTGDSIASAIRNFGDGVEEMRVVDVAEKIAVYREDAEVAEFFDDIQESGAVAIVDRDGSLISIITVNDTSIYFHALAYDMILLEDIEKSLRDHIEAAYTDPQSGELNEDQLQSAIKLVLGREKPYSHLTLYESTQLFCHPRTWNNYGTKYFSITPKALSNLLNIVREIRNPWAHFRSNPTPAQRKQLKFAQLWFKRNDPVYPPDLKIDVDDTSPSELYEVVEESSDTSAFIEGEIEEGDSKYAKLAVYLSNQPEDKEKLELNFDRIEEILGFDLPKSAREHRAWWANDTVGHSWSRDWLDVDWRVASVNMSNQVVRFARIKERQKAYIEFYSSLIDELRRQPEFEHLRNLPDGINWYWTKGVSVSGRGVGSFSFSFGRNGIFRIELYIDSGEKSFNKQFFDLLLAQKEVIEQELGTALSWQRLDHRRASRIERTFKGRITDSDEELATLRAKALPAMAEFVKIIEPRAINAANEVLEEHL